MIDRRDLTEILKEAEDLCRIHGEGIDDFERCREFNNRMSTFLMRLEDMECNVMANRMMDVLLTCNPKTGAHCENSKMVGAMLERMRDVAKSSLQSHDQDKKV